MKTPEIDRDAPLSPIEKALGGCGMLAFIVGILLVGVLFAGCVSEYTGSSTIVGEQLALPEITDSSDNIAVRVYESIKGARVWTAKDSKVTIRYTDCYTNSYFGIVTTRDSMTLTADIEPLYVGEDPATNATESATAP